MTRQLSPTHWRGAGDARELATSEKVERMEINTDRYMLFGEPWVTGGHRWSGQRGNGPALCYVNHTKPWSSLALMVASCLRNQLS